jgi:hypothetical protein
MAGTIVPGKSVAATRMSRKIGLLVEQSHVFLPILAGGTTNPDAHTGG